MASESKSPTSSSETAASAKAAPTTPQTPAKEKRPLPVIIRLGDLLKAEADRNSRIVIAGENIKIGQLIEHPSRKHYLVALSDSEHGKVLVQPHNCTINLDFVAENEITSKQQDKKALTVEELKKQGDLYGIKYIGTPYIDTPKVAAVAPEPKSSAR